MQRLRAWLKANGFKVIRQGVGPEGIELTVLAGNGRVVQLVHMPGTYPCPVIETLESILNGEAEPLARREAFTDRRAHCN